jgi:hypothetical protein
VAEIAAWILPSTERAPGWCIVMAKIPSQDQWPDMRRDGLSAERGDFSRALDERRPGDEALIRWAFRAMGVEGTRSSAG